jgi:hypothetical protein
MHAKREAWSWSGSSSAVDCCCRSASALWPTLQPVAYMLAWRANSGAAGPVDMQPAGSGAGSARSLGHLPTALQLGASLMCFARAACDFTEIIFDVQKHST